MTDTLADSMRDRMYVRVQWLMIIRLAVITVSLVIGFIVLDIPFRTFYHYIAFYYLVSVLYIILFQQSRNFSFLGIFQISIDLLAITSIVAILGPINSVFPTLYILVIVLSNIVFTQYGGLITAGASILLYLSTVLYLFLSASPDYIDTTLGGSRLAFYIAYIYVTIFGAVGYLSNYLSTLLREKSAEFQQLERQSNYVFRQINTGLLLVSDEGIVNYANRAAERILSCPQEQLIDVHWHQLLDIDSVDSVTVRNALEQGTEVELAARDHDGNIVPVATTVSPVEGPAGKTAFNIVLFRDLRAQRENQRQMLEGERLRAIVELSATVAHEIGNPLASISGSAELLLTRVHDDEQRRLLGIIGVETERLVAIVADFLSFTRLRSMVLASVNLNELLMDVVVLLHHSKKFPKGMKLIYHELPEPLHVVVDQKQIKQAFLNIGLNALEAMPDGGELELEIHPDGERGMVEVRMRDTGSGIPPDVLKHMFESFYTTKQEGSGIGLYVTQKIIQSHRGSITVESELGKGTTFHILLPTTAGT